MRPPLSETHTDVPCLHTVGLSLPRICAADRVSGRARARLARQHSYATYTRPSWCRCRRQRRRCGHTHRSTWRRSRSEKMAHRRASTEKLKSSVPGAPGPCRCPPVAGRVPACAANSSVRRGRWSMWSRRGRNIVIRNHVHACVPGIWWLKETYTLRCAFCIIVYQEKEPLGLA